MIIYIATISCLLAIYFYRNFRKRRSAASKWKEIPSEKGLPIIGVVNSIKEPLCNYLFKLSQKHGPIYQIRFGMRTIVVLNTFDYIKAALVENSDALSGRWKAEKYIFDTHNAGIFSLDGSVWAEQRSFILKSLKDFGVGTSRSIVIVLAECGHMLEDLEKVKGQRMNLRRFLSLYSLNVVLKFVMNKRFSDEDPQIDIIRKFMATLVTDNDPVSTFLLMIPFIENHEWLVHAIMWLTSRTSFGDDFHHLIEKEIAEHLGRLDFNFDGDDLIDRFLIKQRRMKEQMGNVGTYTDWQLVMNVLDLLMAGIDTTSTTLVWGFMFMAMFPEIQNKVHEEIIDTIGHERLPTMGDKVSLIYTQAVMDEVLRLSSIAPLCDMHRVVSNVKVRGYFIPGDTLLIPNVFACHLDGKVWENPFEFHPNHFLLTDPYGRMKYRPREELIVFSMGKRQCLGESLGRMKFFIFFTSILQRFRVDLVKEKSCFDVFSGYGGIVRKPDVEEFIFRKR